MLTVFGLASAGRMASDVGGFDCMARSSVEGFKAELTTKEEPQRITEEG